MRTNMDEATPNISTQKSRLGSDPATTRADRSETEVGSVFVSNYPAYSFWGEEDVPQAHRALADPPHPDTKLGLYLHIPFCRKRCKFCYFRVYTDKNSQQIQTYLDALAREVEHYAPSSQQSKTGHCTSSTLAAAPPLTLVRATCAL